MKIRPVLSQDQRRVRSLYHSTHHAVAYRLVHDELMTYREAAVLLGISANTVWRWCQEHLARQDAPNANGHQVEAAS